MSESVEQIEKGRMVYPGRSRWRAMWFRLPIMLWRLGLNSVSKPTYILLTTIGYQSSKPRRTMLEFAFDDGSFYLLSWWGTRANWYQNALAHPYVTLQHPKLGDFHGQVSPVTDDKELRKVYDMMQERLNWTHFLKSWHINPSPDDFVANKHKLAILRADATGNPTPLPQKADLAWIWLPFALILLFINPFVGRDNRRDKSD